MKTIELIVAADGSSRVETKGFAGSECQSASRFLELPGRDAGLKVLLRRVASRSDSDADPPSSLAA